MRTPNLNFIYVKQRVCAPLGRTIYELLAPKSTAKFNITNEIGQGNSLRHNIMSGAILFCFTG